MTLDRRIGAGNVQLWWVPEGGIADPAAPEDTEITAGVDLTPYMTEFNDALSGNTADAATYLDAFDSQIASTESAAPTVTLRYDETAGDPISNFEHGIIGFLVSFPEGTASGTPADTDTCDVIGVQVTNVKQNTPRAEILSFTVSFAADTFDQRVEVQAGV
ncbi:MAG: hypothetical protein GEU73_07650 [Chloroflexi bacterium]|nr:hypothetical protein [Chloroflexota bacterium]